MNDVKNLLFDIWSDLQAKRLLAHRRRAAGRARGGSGRALQARLGATGRTNAERAERPGRRRAKDLVALRLVEDDAAGSPLDTFGAGDPFRPPGSITTSADDSVQGAGPSLGAPGDTGGSSSADGSASTGDTGGASGGAPVTPVTPTPDDGGNDGGTTTVEYRYVVDATFTQNGRTRKVKGMEKLDLLPNEQSPCSCSSARPPRGPTRSFSSTRRLRRPVRASASRARTNARSSTSARLGAGVHERGRRLLHAAHRPDPQGEGRRSRQRRGQEERRREAGQQPRQRLGRADFGASSPRCSRTS